MYIISYISTHFYINEGIHHSEHLKILLLDSFSFTNYTFILLFQHHEKVLHDQYKKPLKTI